jgi:hypothetical protein
MHWSSSLSEGYVAWAWTCGAPPTSAACSSEEGATAGALLAMPSSGGIIVPGVVYQAFLVMDSPYCTVLPTTVWRPALSLPSPGHLMPTRIMNNHWATYLVLVGYLLAALILVVNATCDHTTRITRSTKASAN